MPRGVQEMKDARHVIRRSEIFPEPELPDLGELLSRGRERAKPELGMEVYKRLLEILPGEYSIQQQPKHEGNNIIMVMAPK